MKDLVCDACLKDIDEGEQYIETDNGDVYCSEECLVWDLEECEKIKFKVNE